MLWGQVDPSLLTGPQVADSVQKADFDEVSLSSGTVFINIPLVEFPQLGRLKLRYSIAAGSSTFEPVITLCKENCTTDYNTAWELYSGGSAEINDLDYAFGKLSGSGKCGSTVSSDIVTNGGYTTHPVILESGNNITSGGCASNIVATLESADGSGLRYVGIAKGTWISSSNGFSYGPYTIDRDGTKHGQVIYNQSANTSSYIYSQDVFGNAITYNSGSNYMTDSLSRTIPDVSYGYNSTGLTYVNNPPVTITNAGCSGPLPTTFVQNWTVPALTSSGTATYLLCYAAVSGKTNFGFMSENNVAFSEASLYSDLFLQSVVLPNGTAWIFEYNDRDTSDTTAVNYGNITKVTLPTGATITYVYKNVPFLSTPGAVYETIVKRVIESRTVNPNDGSTPRVWNYSWNLQTTTAPKTEVVTVTDPLGNNSVHTFTYYDFLRETQVKTYQGSGTLLLTKYTVWTQVSSFEWNGL